MAFIPKPPFPNVPRLPGVPQLNRSPLFPAAPPPVLGIALALGRLWQALFTQPVWGIYKHVKPTVPSVDGIETVTVVAERKPVVVPDSFLEFGFRDEYSIADYPIQDGGFANYNKVANPFETVVRLSKGGSKQQRTAFLKALDEIAGTLDLYDIVTPEKTYLNVNVLKRDIYRKGVKGAYFFAEVDVYFQEIRQVTATYSTTSAVTPNARNPSDRPVSNIGNIQPQLIDVTPDLLGIEAPTL